MNTTSPSDSLIPLVDLAQWFTGDDSTRRTLAAEVDVHLQRCGFLVVTNHGIEQQVFADTRAACKRLFHLPEEEKQLLTTADEAYRGWVGGGKESNAATYGVDTPPDLKETFAFGAIDVQNEGVRSEYPIWYAPNVWPDEPVELRPAAERYWREARALADELLQLFALALGLEQERLLDSCRDTTSTGNFNWYWPHTYQAPVEGQYRIGPHTDFGTLTILDREPGMGGLQVLDDEGHWVDAPTIPDSLIVNTGDMLRQWTNDRWQSNEHRVLPPSADAPREELISLIFFHEPDADAMIEPLETCVSPDNPARYEPVTSMDYLAEKFAALVVDSP